MSVKPNEAHTPRTIYENMCYFFQIALCAAVCVGFVWYSNIFLQRRADSSAYCCNDKRANQQSLRI